MSCESDENKRQKGDGRIATDMILPERKLADDLMAASWFAETKIS
jgi:hypothetical protein